MRFRYEERSDGGKGACRPPIRPFAYHSLIHPVSADTSTVLSKATGWICIGSRWIFTSAISGRIRLEFVSAKNFFGDLLNTKENSRAFASQTSAFSLARLSGPVK